MKGLKQNSPHMPNNPAVNQKLLKHFFDYKDGALYWRIAKSSKHGIGCKAGTIGTLSRWYVYVLGYNYSAHTLIFMWHNGYVPPMVDHIDRNVCNDKIENLRECSYRENNFNKSKRKNCSSIYKGVSKNYNKWAVGIQADHKSYYGGLYDTQELAALAYNKMAVKHHGEFANLNIIKK